MKAAIEDALKDNIAENERYTAKMDASVERLEKKFDDFVIGIDARILDTVTKTEGELINKKIETRVKEEVQAQRSTGSGEGSSHPAEEAAPKPSDMSAFEEKIEKLVYAMGLEVEGGKTQLETLTKELDAARKESALGSGKGKGKGEDAWSKRIIDRKNFKEKVMKLEGRGGEPEMRAFSFSLRMFLSEDKSYLDGPGS